MKNILIWETKVQERINAVEKFYKQCLTKKGYTLDWDEDSLYVEKLSTWIGKKDKPILLAHTGNFGNNVNGVIEIIEELNAAFGQLSIILYSGGMTRSSQKNDNTYEFVLDGNSTYSITLANPNNVCIVPHSVGDNLAKDLNLKEAFNVLERGGSKKDFFEIIAGYNSSIDHFVEMSELLYPLDSLRNEKTFTAINFQIEKLINLGKVKDDDCKKLIKAMDTIRARNKILADDEEEYFDLLQAALDKISQKLV